MTDVEPPAQNDVGPATRAARADADNGLERQRQAAEMLPPLLEQVAAHPGDVEFELTFWRAVVDLPFWILTARGELGPNVRPFVILDDQDRGIVQAYSTAEAAREWGIRRGLSEEEAALMLVMPAYHALDYVLALAEKGVYAVWFDGGTWSIPLEYLAPMRQYLIPIGYQES